MKNDDYPPPKGVAHHYIVVYSQPIEPGAYRMQHLYAWSAQHALDLFLDANKNTKREPREIIEVIAEDHSRVRRVFVETQKVTVMR